MRKRTNPSSVRLLHEALRERALFFTSESMSDKQKVLEALKEAGEKGIHSFDLIHKAGTYRVAARIRDLKKEGINIVSIPEPKGNSIGCRYFLEDKKKTTKYKWIYQGNTATEIPIIEEEVQGILF